MGARHVPDAMRRAFAQVGIAASVALLAAAPAAQNSRHTSDSHARHLRAVYAERMEQLFDAWEQAPDEARAAAVALLEEGRGEGGPVGGWPGLYHLGAATRVLEGGDPKRAEIGSLDSLADCLDLQPVPGSFQPQSEGRGEYIRVRVYPADLRVASRAARDVTATLYWIGPGGIEVHARTERVAAAAFAAPGFELHVHSPLSAPGPWELALDLEADDGRVRTHPVPVPCVEGAVPRYQESYRALSDGPYGEWSWVLEDLRRLFFYGMRRADPRVDERLEGVLAVARGSDVLVADDPLAPRLVRFPADAPVGEALRLDAIVPETVERVLLVPTPSRLEADALFAGRWGDGWRRLARAKSAAIYSFAYDSAAGARLADLADELRSRHGGAPVGVVARGDALTELYFGLVREEDLELDFLVASAPTSAWKASDAIPRVPTLLVSPAVDRAEPSDGAEDWVTRAFGGPLPFLAEPRLPELVSGWLE